MEVKLNLNSTGAVKPATPQPNTRIAPVGTDAVEFSGATALNQSFDKVSDVRPEAVAKARELISQPSYPPAETIRKIAVLFAFNVDQNS